MELKGGQIAGLWTGNLGAVGSESRAPVFVGTSGCGHACFHVPMPVVMCAYICGHEWAHTRL